MHNLKEWLIHQPQKLAQLVLDPLIKPIQRKLTRSNLPAREREITNPVLACGRRHFSQNDEDGILLEILRRIAAQPPATFLELGVGDGTECNTIILLALGWRGAWLSGQALAFEPGPRLAFSPNWITKENVTSLATEALRSFDASIEDVSVVSVDLDGNDPHIVRALLAGGAKPKVFIVEYNAKFPPNVDFEIPYNSAHQWRGTDYFGASLLSFTKILGPAGYVLVACNENGVNAFFVSNEFAGLFTDVPNKIEDIYRIEHYSPYPSAGHPTAPETVRYLTI
jgi:hypothetical protein